MDFFRPDDFRRLANPGVESLQVVSPHNAPASRVTITKVTVEPGSGQPRHAHKTSEQIWVALEGSATLLLAEGATKPITAGDAVRFAEGDVHGVENTGATAFVYLSATSPPIDFDYAYADVSDKPEQRTGVGA